MKRLYIYALVFLSGLILIQGCSQTKAPSAPETDPIYGGDLSLQKAAPSLTWTLQFTAPKTLQSVWGSSSTDVFAVGGRPAPLLILHYDGISWTTQVNGGFAAAELRHVWGTSPTDVFAVGGQPGRILIMME